MCSFPLSAVDAWALVMMNGGGFVVKYLWSCWLCLLFNIDFFPLFRQRKNLCNALVIYILSLFDGVLS